MPCYCLAASFDLIPFASGSCYRIAAVPVESATDDAMPTTLLYRGLTYQFMYQFPLEEVNNFGMVSAPDQVTAQAANLDLGWPYTSGITHIPSGFRWTVPLDATDYVWTYGGQYKPTIPGTCNGATSALFRFADLFIIQTDDRFIPTLTIDTEADCDDDASAYPEGHVCRDQPS